MYSFEIPSLTRLLLECFCRSHSIRVIGYSHEVVEFFGVGCQIEKLRRVDGAGDIFPGSPLDHHVWCHCALACVFAEYGVDAGGLAFALREERSTVEGEARVDAPADEIDKGGEDVQGADVLGDGAATELFGVRDYERDSSGALEPRHLVPEPALAEHVAVIGGEDNDSVVVDFAFFKDFE